MKIQDIRKVINVFAKPKRIGIKAIEFSVRAILEFISYKLYSVLGMPLGQAEKRYLLIYL